MKLEVDVIATDAQKKQKAPPYAQYAKMLIQASIDVALLRIKLKE